MGLDNLFVLKSRKDNNLNLTFAAFSNFGELNDWGARNFKRNDDSDDSGCYSVTKENIEKLLQYIEPVANDLKKLDDNTIAYYDNNNYPNKWEIKHYGNSFSPYSSDSAFGGFKVLRLYYILISMLSVLRENNCSFEPYNKELYFEFISSRQEQKLYE